jgi:uncharacterized membrane protein
MTFEHPWALLLIIPAVTAVLLVARHGRTVVGRTQSRWARAIRVFAVTALCLALAQPHVILPSADQTVVFLLDRSDSISDASATAQEQMLQEALEAVPPSARWSVALFGAETRTDRSLSVGNVLPDIVTDVDGSATNLGAALRAVAALMPSAGSRRVVVLSDMAPTDSDGRQAARELAEQGVVVDVVELPGGRSPDALVESVRLPTTVRQGDIVRATAHVRSNTVGEAVLRVDGVDEDVREIVVELEQGSSTIEFEFEANGTGFLPITATLDAPFDEIPQNDTATGLTRVLGPARVALVEGVAGEGGELSRALAAGGVQVDVLGDIPSATALLPYDAVVLVNIATPDPEPAEALASFVEDLGRGVIVVGGDQSFGMGDYHQTPLETILPVSSNPDDLLRRQPVAEVLVIDTSGSMAACHCDGQGANMATEGGINKTDISQAGAALAIEALDEMDRVGVLSFSSGYEWVLPLATKPSKATVDEALGGLFPEGDTEISRALEEALDQLRGAPESLRHIVLFTDGWDPTDADLVPVAREIADEGVTLSVLGTGEGPGHTLERMAEVGGGRYYAGTDLTAVPDIFVEETLTVARNLINEGSFLPTVVGRSEVTASLTESPPLLGYVLTKAKGSAQVLLEIGQADPLLATWQRGLGQVAAWTSDATARWSSGWVTWEGYVDFWGGVLRDVLPAGLDTPPDVWVDGSDINVAVFDEGLTDDSSAVARIRRPDGSVATEPLSRATGSSFEGTFSAGSPGAYWVSVTTTDQQGGTKTVSSGTVSSYEPEFAFREPDPTLAVDLAELTGGRVDPDSSTVWNPAPLRGTSDRAILPWLVVLALVAFLTDVALRRLSFTPAESSVPEPPKRPRRKRGPVERPEPTPDAPAPTVSDSETIQRLMRRKQR